MDKDGTDSSLENIRSLVVVLCLPGEFNPLNSSQIIPLINISIIVQYPFSVPHHVMGPDHLPDYPVSCLTTTTTSLSQWTVLVPISRSDITGFLSLDHLFMGPEDESDKMGERLEVTRGTPLRLFFDITFSRTNMSGYPVGG